MVSNFFYVVTNGEIGVCVNAPVGQGILYWEAIIDQLPYEKFQLFGNWEAPKPSDFGVLSSTVALPMEVVVGTFTRESVIGSLHMMVSFWRFGWGKKVL